MKESFMTTTVTKRVLVTAVSVPYLIASVLFFCKMTETCGARSLIFTIIAWAIGSVFSYFATRELSREVEGINDGDKFFYIFIIFLLWVAFAFLEVLIERKLLSSDVCGPTALVPLVAWAGGSVIVALVSSGVPDLFKD